MEILNEFIDANLPAQAAKKRKTSSAPIKVDRIEDAVGDHDDKLSTIVAEHDSCDGQDDLMP